MIKVFDGNPLAIALASSIGGLLLIALVIGVAWTFPPRASGPDGDSEDAIAQLDIPELEDSEPLQSYAVISERPVFNENRQPAIEDELDEEEEPEEEEVDAPDVQLSGVVITPNIRMVTLRSPDHNESLVAFEGQPLEGDFGTWQVSQIRARDVTLSSASGESLELKLEVHNTRMAEPPKMTVPDKGDSDEPAAQQAETSDQPMTRAEEIRQRIAQRREELRRAADENGEDAEPEIDYRTAIQSMVNRSRRENNDDEDRD